MSSRLCALAASLIILAACGAENPVAPDQSPAWLSSLIRRIESEPVRNPPAVVARYDYKGQKVYFVPEYCCDIWSDLYAFDGTLICHPGGGVSGRGDGKCPDFLSARRNERVIWRDPRGQ